jgi:hypothetical protein
VSKFPYYDEPDIEASGNYQPDDDDATSKYNFNEGEWVHIAIVTGPEHTRFYVTGQIPRVWDPQYEMIRTADWEIDDFETYDPETDIEHEMGALPNGLLSRIFLPYQNVGTFDEFCFFAVPENDPDPEIAFHNAHLLVRERFSEGRYYNHGEWLSPELQLPIDARIIGSTGTELIPRTLYTGEKRQPNEEPDDSTSDIKVSLLNKNGNNVSDHNGRVDLYCPINNRELFVPMADSAFDGKFHIRVEIDAYPFDESNVLSNNGFPNEYDFYRARFLNDTPVLDDITIIYSTGEEIISWEIVQ